ncbi:MAG: hypothetical protein RSE18_00240 [Acinetobacter sp.]
MTKLVESDNWSLLFECDIKGVHIEAIPKVGIHGLSMDYRVKKGLNYAINADREVITFESVDAAEAFVIENKDKF